MAAGQRREGAAADRGLARAPLEVAGLLREPRGIGHQVHGHKLHRGGFGQGADRACRTLAALVERVAEHCQGVAVLAHDELAVAQLVERHVHRFDLRDHRIVGREQLVALCGQCGHRLPAWQAGEALRLDELRVFVEQRAERARFDLAGEFFDGQHRGVTTTLALPDLQHAAAEGQARVWQGLVRGTCGEAHLAPHTVDQEREQFARLPEQVPVLFVATEQGRSELAQAALDERALLFHRGQGLVLIVRQAFLRPGGADTALGQL